MCKGRWQNINQNTNIYCVNNFNLQQAKHTYAFPLNYPAFLLCRLALYCVQNKDDREYLKWILIGKQLLINEKNKKKKNSMRRVNTGDILTCYGKTSWTNLTIQTFFHQCISESVEKFSPQEIPARYKPYNVGINHITRRWRPYTFTSRSC